MILHQGGRKPFVEGVLVDAETTGDRVACPLMKEVGWFYHLTSSAPTELSLPDPIIAMKES